MLREPLIKYSMSLRDLKHTTARRNPKLMAVVLSEGCNNAGVCFRPRPKGPSEQSYLRVGAPPNVQTLLRDAALTYDRSEGQRHRILNQRLPKMPVHVLFAFICFTFSHFLHAEEANYFFIRYLPGENWNHSISYEDQPGLKKHLAYLQRLHINDQVVMGGLINGEPGSLMLVRTGSLEEAEAIAKQDPGVVTRIVKAEITGWNVQMSSMRFVRRQPVPPIKDPDQTFRLKRLDPESRLNIEN